VEIVKNNNNNSKFLNTNLEARHNDVPLVSNRPSNPFTRIQSVAQKFRVKSRQLGRESEVPPAEVFDKGTVSPPSKDKCEKGSTFFDSYS
jgi:hypothetical protein